MNSCKYLPIPCSCFACSHAAGIIELGDSATNSVSALLSDTFAMDCPVTTERDYISSHVTGFSDEDDHQRVGGLASMPVTNGLRYHTQQPAMQDLQ